MNHFLRPKLYIVDHAPRFLRRTIAGLVRVARAVGYSRDAKCINALIGVLVRLDLRS